MLDEYIMTEFILKIIWLNPLFELDVKIQNKTNFIYYMLYQIS